MIPDLDRLAAEQARPREELARQHALEGLLRRLAASPHEDRWVLRGSFLTRFYCAPWPRSAADLDFLDLDPFDHERTRDRLREMLAVGVGDGCDFDPEGVRDEPIWQETPFPGVRFQIPGGFAGWCGEVQIDVAFHDPVAPPPRRVALPTLTAPVEILGCSRETLIAWKVHGLFEKGLGTFRPKDLHDLALLSRGVTLDPVALQEALEVAFRSRKTPFAWTERLARGVFGQSRWSQEKWRRFRAATPSLPIPPIEEVVREVTSSLGPTLAACLRAEKGP